MTHVATFAHGLVIGKFYPPHLGHIYLIRTAARQCKLVTVAVLASGVEVISMTQRAAWLRACFPDDAHVRVVSALDDIPVDYDDPAVWEAHVSIMRQAVRSADNERGGEGENKAIPVDAVFTSEHYGEELAQRFNAQNVCLDQTRSLYPISGSAARADICANWDMLPAPVRAGLALRIVVLGAESSGTTSLARDLTQALRARGGIWSKTAWVAEYGREYSANLLALARSHDANCLPEDLVWAEEDFTHIATEQCRREDEGAQHGSPVLICDTDALATTVWHERYMQRRSAAVEGIPTQMSARSLYILTDHDGVAFEDDGLRDGEHLRPWMTRRFEEVLAAQQTPWVCTTGSAGKRLAFALQCIDEQIAKAWKFTVPLEYKSATDD